MRASWRGLKDGTAETLVEPRYGLTKRVYFGQRWLLIQINERHGALIKHATIRAYHTEAQAQAQIDTESGLRGSGLRTPLEEYIVQAEVRVLSTAMGKEGAVVVLQQSLAALFPYPNPMDDPDRHRAENQVRCKKALDVLTSM